MLLLLFAFGKKKEASVNIAPRVRIVDIVLVPFCKSYNRLKQITNAAYHKTSFILKILSKGIQLLIY